MEVPEYYMGGYFGAGVDPLSQEKRHTEQKSGENFVDELLDFSNEDVMMTEGFLENVDGNSTDSSTITPVDSYNSSVSGGGKNHFCLNMDSRGFADSQFSGDLGVPYEDLAHLEWLSNFVEDSFSTEDELKTIHLLSGATASKIATNPHTPESSSSCETPRNASPLFHPETPLPGKARSKRSRAAPGDWSTRLLHVVNPTTPTTIDTMKFIPVDLKSMHPKSSPIKRRESSHPDMGSDRKCLHCATEKTPQWRTGPMGPKTLCNACGVRYKSGRLVPEYRPAASPTFVTTKHSNSHRKVLELRRQKDLARQQHQQQQQFLSQTSIFGVSNGGDEYLVHHHNGSDYRHMI